MANDKRLVEANALLEKMQFRLPIDNNTAEVIAECVEIARRIIENAPTVDAVEVVRCKDCRHCTEIGLPRCRITGRNMTDDDFCSRGERREGE